MEEFVLYQQITETHAAIQGRVFASEHSKPRARIGEACMMWFKRNDICMAELESAKKKKSEKYEVSEKTSTRWNNAIKVFPLTYKINIMLYL